MVQAGMLVLPFARAGSGVAVSAARNDGELSRRQVAARDVCTRA